MKKIFLVTAMVITAFFVVFAGRLHEGVSSASAVTALSSSNQPGFLTRARLTTSTIIPLTKGSDVVPLSGQSNMLQFTAGGHVLGFQPTKAYLASLDHALSVEFLNTKGVMPKTEGNLPVASTLTKAPALRKVLYQNLWEGISLTYESTQDGITESTYHIAPGTDVSQIRLRYNVPVLLEKDGSLKFAFERGFLTESKPIAWQEINGRRTPVTVAFKVSGDEVGFSIGDYDPHKPLIVDPTYAWHTFYGAADNNDFGIAISVDTGGDVYITGVSYASWGSPLNTHSGNGDLFVLKLDSSGAYQWHTFYGSANLDFGIGIIVDTAGNVYVTGSSYESWGSPLNSHSGNSDIFVLKLDSNGAYQWHTFYGSIGQDYVCNIAVDTTGNTYIVGYSWWLSWGLPLNPSSSGSDFFVLKLDNNGAYQWHTFYGSINTTMHLGYGIAVDTSGNVYITGVSDGSWGSPLNPHSNYNEDIFVLKLDSNGAYQWNTFHGAPGHVDYGYAIAVDTAGNVYITGESYASWGSPLNTYSGIDYKNLFVLKLDSNGDYQWNTFYGSVSGHNCGYGITVNTAGNVYITGESYASWGSPLNPHSGNSDLVILKLNNSGTYQWHTFYGSNSTDSGRYIAVDTSSNVYVTGYSNASWGTPLHAHSGNEDLFVLKLNDLPPLYTTFTGYGLYKYDGSIWTQINQTVPASMVASGTTLYANFTGYGLYSWNGSTWTQLNQTVSASMVASETTLYVNFTGYGLYSWNGSTWTQINQTVPASMVASGSTLYANFTGYGLYSWNGSTWTQINQTVPASMVASGSTLYANFTGYGLYSWNGSTWTQINQTVPASMVASGSTLYANFTGYGLYSWNGSIWTQLNQTVPASMVASGTTLYANFTGYGLYSWNGSIWTQLNQTVPASMVTVPQ